MTNPDNRRDKNPDNGLSSKPKADRLSISQAGLKPEEIHALEALRLFCTSYANPDSFAWELAFETCQHRFGPQHGPSIGMAAMDVMRSLRQTRNSTFKFTNPACPCCRGSLSDHELHMMLLLKADRADDGISRQTHAVILCEGNNPLAFLRNLKTLADRLNDVSKADFSEEEQRRKPRLKISYTRP